MRNDTESTILGALHQRERELIEAAYCDYAKVLRSVQDATHTCGPHCDELMLHAPGECSTCDKRAYRALHDARKVFGITHTGQDHEALGLRPCPASLFRDVETMHRWHGNAPQLPATVA